jgi:2',3'-cyclic-nucleotide 2'-phosphodiesterase (5'-nucleotidase family)
MRAIRARRRDELMRLYHTSDLHDRRHIAAPLRALRDRAPGLLLDCGDSLRGSQTLYYRREPIVTEIDAAGYDVQAMGNREFHYLYAAVRARAALMRHPLTCANLVDTFGRPLPFVRDVTLERTDADGSPWTFRFFGLLVVQYPPASPWERLFGWRFLDPLAVAAAIAAETPPGVTLVALSHLGLRTDRRLAAAVPRLDLILGGHSHDTLPEPEFVNGVPIVHAGPYGAFASQIDLVRAGGRSSVASFALVPLLAAGGTAA